MAYLNVYLYDTYEAAQSDLQKCDDYWGFPIGSTTKTADILPYGNQFYIVADVNTIPVLGENYITLQRDEQNGLE